MNIQIAYDASCPVLAFAAGEMQHYLSRMLAEKGTLAIALTAAEAEGEPRLGCGISF